MIACVNAIRGAAAELLTAEILKACPSAPLPHLHIPALRPPLQPLQPHTSSHLEPARAPHRRGLHIVEVVTLPQGEASLYCQPGLRYTQSLAALSQLLQRNSLGRSGSGTRLHSSKRRRAFEEVNENRKWCDGGAGCTAGTQGTAV